MNVQILKNKKLLGLILVAGLLGFGVSVFPLQTRNLGFEGVKVDFYGAEFRFNQDWEGTYQLHKYQDAEHPLVYHEYVIGPFGSSDTIYWSSVATPNDAGVGWKIVNPGGTTGIKEKPYLGCFVENNVQLQHITRQGDPDPLAWNIDDPLEGREIQYTSREGIKVAETNETVTYEYELTKESFLITPAEFWIGFYLDPAQEDAATGSGWREGEWSDLTLWYRTDFHTWDNAYYDEWLEDPQPEDEIYTTEYGGTIISKEKKVEPDAYRGGFPIAGWIQGWEKAGWEKMPWEEGSKSEYADEAEEPVWFQTRGSGEGKQAMIYSPAELANLKDILMAKCKVKPGLIGQFLSLYDEPSVSFSYDDPDVQPSYTNWGDIDPEDSDQGLTGQIKTPDSSMKKVMYFPINIVNFGTYAQAHGWQGLNGWTVFYPSCFLRVRMIYGVYGTFKYLWTEQVTKDFVITDPDTGETVYGSGLDFPDEIEKHGTTVIYSRGPITPFADLAGDIGSWFSNPFNQLWTFFNIMVVVVLVVTFLNPGLWASVIGSYKSSRKSSRGKTKKWK